MIKVILDAEEGPLKVRTHPISRMGRWQEEIQKKHTNVLGFGSINDSIEYVIITPFWFPLIVCGVCSAILWPSKTRRYELSTLFAAITIVAIVLGLAAYAAKNN
jgi:hypothetical protein